jgi:hypothetical protein
LLREDQSCYIGLGVQTLIAVLVFLFIVKQTGINKRLKQISDSTADIELSTWFQSQLSMLNKQQSDLLNGRQSEDLERDEDEENAYLAIETEKQRIYYWLEFLCCFTKRMIRKRSDKMARNVVAFCHAKISIRKECNRRRVVRDPELQATRIS